MHRLHIFLVALLLAGAAAVGTLAVLRTTGLGGAGRSAAADTAVRRRAVQLDRFEASLRRQLARKPPPLPPVPKRPAAAAPAPAPRVVYRRPPAVVVVRHVHHGDDGHEGGESGGGGDD
ncbi:MAG TPA: hypothetical protein VFL60_10760 [Gaiellaceae bacterium]|nr:hypothetical protein [Gaiellaceae bacterium]